MSTPDQGRFRGRGPVTLAAAGRSARVSAETAAANGSLYGNVLVNKYNQWFLYRTTRPIQTQQRIKSTPMVYLLTP